MTIRQHLLNMFSGKDNQTLDLGRIIWFKGAAVFSGLAIWHVYKTSTFDFVAFATGFGAILGAGGAALWAKKDTEPGA
jgi:hypothetical protein